MPPDARPRTYVLTLSCSDRIGIVADVAGFLVAHGCNIEDSAQFGDKASQRFFLRISFEAPPGTDMASLRADFVPLAVRRGMAFELVDQAVRTPTLIMVSRLGHCLNDLLFRVKIGALPIDVRAIVSNHTDLAGLAEGAGITFHHLPVTPETKTRQEDALERLVRDAGVELIVLARYMQILSAEFCGRHPGRIINIHHSFLPSFKGARPYHRAHERGVKLIGATAHYVTENLDEGPIIEQAVGRAEHQDTAQDLTAVGRDIEAMVLARAVKWHAEHRILLNGHRTVIFK